MTAWQLLTANSSLPAGTAWEHLNNQEGGGGEIVYIDRVHTVYGEQVVTLMADYYIELDDEVIEVVLEKDYVVTLEDEFGVS